MSVMLRDFQRCLGKSFTFLRERLCSLIPEAFLVQSCCLLANVGKATAPDQVSIRHARSSGDNSSGTEAKTGWGVQSFCSGFAHPKHLLAKEEIEKFREAFKRTGEEPVPWVAHGSTYPCQSHWKGKLKQQAEPP